MCRNRCANEICPSGAENDADKLLSITGGPNPRTYTYDQQGRTATIVNGSGTTSITYDYDGRATSITYPNASSDSFGYNGLGARISSSGVNGSKTFRRAGLGVTSSVLDDGTKKYTPGISSRENGVSTFQHSGLKNALDQTNSSETVTASRHYDAFGNVINSSGTWEGPFGYAGSFGYQEDGNGLKLLGHRYYDSDTGRFLTSDPIGSGKNWYTYAGNSPVTRIDPSGLHFMTIAVYAVIDGMSRSVARQAVAYSDSVPEGGGRKPWDCKMWARRCYLGTGIALPPNSPGSGWTYANEHEQWFRDSNEWIEVENHPDNYRPGDWVVYTRSGRAGHAAVIVDNGYYTDQSIPSGNKPARPKTTKEIHPLGFGNHMSGERGTRFTIWRPWPFGKFHNQIVDGNFDR